MEEEGGGAQLLKAVHRMRTRAYVDTPLIDYMATLHVDHVGLEDPGWPCKLPECLMVHAWTQNLDVPGSGVAKHSARMLATLGAENGNKGKPVRTFLRNGTKLSIKRYLREKRFLIYSHTILISAVGRTELG